MKHIFLALTFATTAASAADVAYGAHNLGGIHVLTDEPCKNTALDAQSRSRSYHMYSTNASGVLNEGCFFIQGGHSVNVLWHKPVVQHQVFPLHLFKLFDKKQRGDVL